VKELIKANHVDRELFNIRFDEAVDAIVLATGEAINNSGRGLPRGMLVNHVARRLVARVKRGRRASRTLSGSLPREKDIFDTGVPSRRYVEIDLRGKQSTLAGDILVRGKLLAVDGDYVVLRVPKKNVLGWGWSRRSRR